MATKKTPIHMHSHPAYEWIALVLTVSIIFAVAGWYYLIYSQGLNDDLVLSVKNMASPKREATVSSTTTVTDIKAETDSIDQDLNDVSDSDMSDVQLDNTILGIQ